MKRLLNLIGMLLVLISCYYFVRIVLEHASTLPTLKWNLKLYTVLAFATVIYCVATIIGGIKWYALLRSSGESIKVSKTLIIFSLSQFGKYIPGNIGQHIGRITLSKAQKLNASRVIFTMVLEAGWLVVISSVLAIVTLLSEGKNYNRLGSGFPTLGKIIFLAIGAIIVPFIVLKSVKELGSRFINKFGEKSTLPNIYTFLICSMLDITTFLLMGIVINILAFGLYSIAQINILLLTGIFSFAWIAGFLMPGAPAGIGVREVILVSTLTPLYGTSSSMGITVFLRLVSTLGDFLIFIIALVFRRKFLEFHSENQKQDTYK